MTQPDQLFPSESANAVSFHDYQQMDEDDWKDLLRAQAEERLEFAEFGFSFNKTTLTEHTEAITNLQDVASVMNTTVAYLGDEQQMVSFPRILLSVPTPSGSNVPPKSRNILDPVEIVYSYVHHFSTTPVIRPKVQIGKTLGDIIYTPIIADRHGRVEGVTWVGGADTSIFSIDHYFVSLCALDPSGDVVKFWDSGDVKDTEANVSEPDEIYIPINTTQECSPGQILFAAIQEIAPGGLQTARTIGAWPLSNISRTSAEILDAWCYIAPNYSQGIPSSIPFASLTRENRYLPWFGLRIDASEEGS